MDSFNESYKKGKLTDSQRQAVITLLAKKDKNRAFLRNWRPISLLNIDYKIASKAIAQRIQKVLPSVIHSDQCGYVSDRQIGDAVRAIADVMDYTKKNNSHGLMIFIDFARVIFAADEVRNFEASYILKSSVFEVFAEGFHYFGKKNQLLMEVNSLELSCFVYLISIFM